MLLKAQLGRIVLLDLLDRLRELLPGLVDGSVGADLYRSEYGVSASA